MLDNAPRVRTSRAKIFCAQQEGKTTLHAADALLAASKRRAPYGWRRAGSQGRYQARPSRCSRDSLPADRQMAVETLAQFRLQELPRRRVRQAVDEHDIVRHLPLRQLLGEEIEERLLGRRSAVARLDDQQWALLPNRVRDRDDGGFEDVGVGHRKVLDL